MPRDLFPDGRPITLRHHRREHPSVKRRDGWLFETCRELDSSILRAGALSTRSVGRVGRNGRSHRERPLAGCDDDLALAFVHSLDRIVLRPRRLSVPKIPWSRGRRISASMTSTLAPVCARLIAVLTAVVVLPSDGTLDVMRSVFGARPAVESSTEVRSCL